MGFKMKGWDGWQSLKKKKTGPTETKTKPSKKEIDESFEIGEKLENFDTPSDIIGRQMKMKSPAKQNGKKPTGKKGLRATEHEGTHVYKGEDQREKIMDLEDRIGFLKSDVEEAEGKATSMKDPGFHIKKDIASLKEELKAVRGEDRPDPEWENADEVD